MGARSRPPTLAAVVLAAGASERMGRPKATLQWRGHDLVYHAIEAVLALPATPVVVVRGAATFELETIQVERGVEVVDHPGWAAGPTSSLQVGLRACLARAPELDGVCVHTIDRPRISRATMRALGEAWRAAPTAVWQPSHDKTRGHPSIWPRDAFDELLALEPTQTRRELLRGPFASRRRRLEVRDPGILENVDDPQAFARLVESPG